MEWGLKNSTQLSTIELNNGIDDVRRGSSKNYDTFQKDSTPSNQINDVIGIVLEEIVVNKIES